MFNKSILAAAILTVGAIAGGTAASAAEIGVRHSHGYSNRTVHSGVSYLQSNTLKSADERTVGGSLTFSGSGTLDAPTPTDIGIFLQTPAVADAFVGLAGELRATDTIAPDKSFRGGAPISNSDPGRTTGADGGEDETEVSTPVISPDWSFQATATMTREREASVARSSYYEGTSFTEASGSTFSELSTFSR